MSDYSKILKYLYCDILRSINQSISQSFILLSGHAHNVVVGDRRFSCSRWTNEQQRFAVNQESLQEKHLSSSLVCWNHQLADLSTTKRYIMTLITLFTLQKSPPSPPRKVTTVKMVRLGSFLTSYKWDSVIDRHSSDLVVVVLLLEKEFPHQDDFYLNIFNELWLASHRIKKSTN